MRFYETLYICKTNFVPKTINIPAYYVQIVIIIYIAVLIQCYQGKLVTRFLSGAHNLSNFVS